MGLAEKMFSRATTTCPLRSDCHKDSNKRYFKSLFEDDWEVFVIRRDNERGKFDWFTLCCEAAQSQCGTIC
jgi:hypothetical protein